MLKDESVLKLAAAVALNEYAVRFRYPDHMEIDDIEIAKKAINLAEEVQQFVQSKIGI